MSQKFCRKTSTRKHVWRAKANLCLVINSHLIMNDKTRKKQSSSPLDTFSYLLAHLARHRKKSLFLTGILLQILCWAKIERITHSVAYSICVCSATLISEATLTRSRKWKLLLDSSVRIKISRKVLLLASAENCRIPRSTISLWWMSTCGKKKKNCKCHTCYGKGYQKITTTTKNKNKNKKTKWKSIQQEL